MKIKFFAPVLHFGGYQEMSRRIIAGINRYFPDIPMSVFRLCPELKTDFGKDGLLCRSLLDKEIQQDINLFFFPPHLWFEEYYRKDALNVVFTMFEADKVNADWVKIINKADLLLVPCEWNVEVFRNSGVSIPIEYVHCGIDDERTKTPTSLPGVSGEDFVFYSIFEWGERKNPSGLIHAYMSEFTNVYDVHLVIKSNIEFPYEHDKIKLESHIARLKSELKLWHYPKVSVFGGKVFTNQEMDDFHKRGDCFVSPHRGEGWGLPIFDAMSFGNPVVVTGKTGNADFATEQNSYLVDSFPRPVFNMDRWNEIYTAEMNFLEPNIDQFKKHMRRVYENRSEALDKGVAAKKDIYTKFHLYHTTNVLVDTLRRYLTLKI